MGKYLESFNIEGKNILITGGRRGIGKGIFEAFAQAGCNVGIMGISDGSDVAGDMMKKYGGNHKFYQGDVTVISDCKRVCEAFNNDYGSFDVMVNNAGIARLNRTLNMPEDTLEQWYDVINTNLNGVFNMCYFAGKIMKEQGYGNIINISSMSADLVNLPQWQVGYNTSKAGVNHLTRSLAAEWAEFGIRVNAIAPGYIQTEMTVDNDNGWTKGFVTYWTNSTPIKKIGSVDQVGAMAVFLASDASNNCIGAVLKMDGGYSLAK